MNTVLRDTLHMHWCGWVYPHDWEHNDPLCEHGRYRACPKHEQTERDAAAAAAWDDPIKED